MKHNKFTCGLRDRKLFEDVAFKLLDEDGVFHEYEVPYIIYGGSYIKWKCLITGYRVFSNLQKAARASAIESLSHRC